MVTEVKIADGWSSGVRNIATDGVENLLFHLWDGIAVKDTHGMVLGVSTTTVVGVNYIQHLSQPV